MTPDQAGERQDDAAFRRPGGGADQPLAAWTFGRAPDEGMATPRPGPWTAAPAAAQHPAGEPRVPPGVAVPGRLDEDDGDPAGPGWFRIVAGAVALLVGALVLGTLLSRPWAADDLPAPAPAVSRR